MAIIALRKKTMSRGCIGFLAALWISSLFGTALGDAYKSTAKADAAQNIQASLSAAGKYHLFYTKSVSNMDMVVVESSSSSLLNENFATFSYANPSIFYKAVYNMNSDIAMIILDQSLPAKYSLLIIDPVNLYLKLRYDIPIAIIPSSFLVWDALTYVVVGSEAGLTKAISITYDTLSSTFSTADIVFNPLVTTSVDKLYGAIKTTDSRLVIVGGTPSFAPPMGLIVICANLASCSPATSFPEAIGYTFSDITEQPDGTFAVTAKSVLTSLASIFKLSSSGAYVASINFDNTGMLPTPPIHYSEDYVGFAYGTGSNQYYAVVAWTAFTVASKSPLASLFSKFSIFVDSVNTLRGKVNIAGFDSNQGYAGILTSSCPPGFTLQSASDMCIACSPGYYKPSFGSDACTVVPAGGYQPNPAATDYTKCPTGTYSSSTMQTLSTTCLDCAVGTYNNIEGSAQCTDCPAGKYQDIVKQTSCKTCLAGTYSSANKSTSCTNCSVGTYQDASNSNSCKDCPTGKYQAATGKTYCDICAIGYSQSQTKQTSCNKCPTGYYQDQTNQANCIACSPGTFNPSLAATSASNCLICAIGEYQSFPGQASCNKCPVGTYQKGPIHARCFSCEAGTYNRDLARTVCDLCPIGTYMNLTGQTGCNECAVNTYQNITGSIRCFQCPEGQQSSHGQTKCYPICKAGEVYDPLSAEPIACKPCPQGTYQLEGICAPCPVGTHQHIVGADSCIACDIGQYQDLTGQIWCKACEPGTYQNITGAPSCKACGVGMYQDITGMTSCTSCPAGTYQNETKQASCKPCALGSYSGLLGSTNCTACPVGTFASTVGQAVCTNCTAETFQNLTGQIACNNCPAGLYQDAEGMTGCRRCPGGFIDVAGPNETVSCSACPKGTIRVNETCVPCENCLLPLEAKNDVVFGLLGLVLVGFALMQLIALYTDQLTLNSAVVDCIKEQLNPTKYNGHGAMYEIFSIISQAKKAASVFKVPSEPKAYEISESGRHINETPSDMTDKVFLESCQAYKEMEEKHGEKIALEFATNTLNNNPIVLKATQAYLDDDIIRGPVTFLKVLKHYYSYIAMLVKADINAPRSIRVLLGFIAAVGNVFITGCFYYNLDGEDDVNVDYYNVAGKVIPYGIYSALCMVVLKILFSLFLVRRYTPQGMSIPEMMGCWYISTVARVVGVILALGWIIGTTAGVIVFALSMSDMSGSNWMKSFGAAAATEFIVFPIFKILLIIGFGSFMLNTVKSGSKTLGCGLFACIINFCITYL